MVEAVRQSIEYIESSDSIRKRVRKIVLPNVVMFVGILAMLIICTLVAIPQIQNVFDSIGSKDYKILVYTNNCNRCNNRISCSIFFNTKRKISMGYV